MKILSFALITLALFIRPCLAADWPEFLGPSGAARTSDSVPSTWSETENLAWKVDLPGSGSSSPIVVGDQVILTCYVSGENAQRQVISFNKSTGEQHRIESGRRDC
jgi:hypothetical protein